MAAWLQPQTHGPPKCADAATPGPCGHAAGRVPAGNNGIVGIKPSVGRFSTTGEPSMRIDDDRPHAQQPQYSCSAHLCQTPQMYRCACVCLPRLLPHPLHCLGPFLQAWCLPATCWTACRCLPCLWRMAPRWLASWRTAMLLVSAQGRKQCVCWHTGVARARGSSHYTRQSPILHPPATAPRPDIPPAQPCQPGKAVQPGGCLPLRPAGPAGEGRSTARCSVMRPAEHVCARRQWWLCLPELAFDAGLSLCSFWTARSKVLAASLCGRVRPGMQLHRRWLLNAAS